VYENSRVSAALRTVYSSLQALQRHKSNVSSPATDSPATASPASSTASPPSTTTLTTATTAAGNFSTPGAAVKDALWMHKRNAHLESEVSLAGSDCVCWGDCGALGAGGPPASADKDIDNAVLLALAVARVWPLLMVG
jgi:hypothetical protein